MASKENEDLFQCCMCHNGLNLESKTLPCLHSICPTCFGLHFKGATDENGHCPQCQEPIKFDQLDLSPWLIRSLNRLNLNSTELKCHWCLEDGIESIPNNWCDDCTKLFCGNCHRCHGKSLKEHSTRSIKQIDKSELIRLMEKEECSVHKKEQNCYCERCNLCFCEVCYHVHCNVYPECLSDPLSVREEALKKKRQGPTVLKQMDDLEIDVKSIMKKTKDYTVKLNADCDLECQNLWQNYEEIRENLKQKTNQLCFEIKRLTNEQVNRWNQLLVENERLLKQLEILRLNIQHLLSESHTNEDIVCGLQTLKSKLSCQLQKPIEENCELKVMIPLWWHQILQDLKTESIGSVSLEKEREKLYSSENNLIPMKEWNAQGSNQRGIQSIFISKEDNHVFLGCYDNERQNISIMEFSDDGVLLDECHLRDESGLGLLPWEMCQISQNILVVLAGLESGSKIYFFERSKNRPLLKTNNIIFSKIDYDSLCEIDQTIFMCDWDFQVNSFSKEGKKLKTITKVESWGRGIPIIRADPANRKFWLTKQNGSELFCFDPDGKKLNFLKIEENIGDFCLNKFGKLLYFCNPNGIYSFQFGKILYKFEKKSEIFPRMFIQKNKLFVSHRYDCKNYIKIFKISD